MATKGVIFRSYAKKPENVERVVSRALHSAKKATGLILAGYPVFDRVLFVVPVGDEGRDCGLTASALKETFYSEGVPVEVLEADAHPNSGALNIGFRWLSNYDVKHALVTSNKALSYLSPIKVGAMSAALDEGACVAGLAVDELVTGVLEGRVQNTFAMWDVAEVLDLDPSGFEADRVEEIAVSVRLIRKYGSCIAVFDAVNRLKLNIQGDKDAQKEHRHIVATKTERQLAEAERLGVDFSFIRGGIMPDYPTTI